MTQMTFATFAEAAEAGYLSVNETRGRVSGTPLQVADTSGGHWFGYSYAIVRRDTWQIVLNGTNCSLTAEENRLGMPGCFTTLFAVADIEDALRQMAQRIFTTEDEAHKSGYLSVTEARTRLKGTPYLVVYVNDAETSTPHEGYSAVIARRDDPDNPGAVVTGLDCWITDKAPHSFSTLFASDAVEAALRDTRRDTREVVQSHD